MSNQISIIGVGSPFGVDNIGQCVIELLQENLNQKKIKNKFQINYFDRPGMHLLEYIKYFKIVHIIDAIVSQNSVGTIHRYEDIQVLQNNTLCLSSHGFGVAEVLALGKALNCLPSNIIIHGIEINKHNLFNLDNNYLYKQCHILAKRIEEELCLSINM